MGPDQPSGSLADLLQIVYVFFVEESQNWALLRWDLRWVEQQEIITSLDLLAVLILLQLVSISLIHTELVH